MIVIWNLLLMNFSPKLTYCMKKKLRYLISDKHFLVPALIFYSWELILVYRVFCKHASETYICLFILFHMYIVLGFQSTGDCSTPNSRDSSEDACLWCWEQGYLNTQGHRGNISRIASLYKTSSACLCWNPDLKLLFWAVFCKAVKEAWSVQSRLCMLTSLLGWRSR